MKNRIKLLLLTLLLYSRVSFAQQWWPVGDGFGASYVNALETDTNTTRHILYAGGTSNQTTNGTYTGKLARWNGNDWAPFDSLHPNQFNNSSPFVKSLKFINSYLYIGGFINLLSTKNGIARWDGTNTVYLNGLTGNFDLVNSIVEYNNHVYIAGDFFQANNSQGVNSDYINCVTMWNDSSSEWVALGMPPNDGVYASSSPPHQGEAFTSIVYNNELYVGGSFDQAGGNVTQGLAKWNGSTWSNATDPVNDAALSLAIYNGELYKAWGTIQKWNGSTWVTVGTTSTSTGQGYILAMKVYNGKLTVAGNFSGIDGVPANNIAAYDGSSWSAFGIGTAGIQGNSGIVEALAVMDGSLYAGGSFTLAGGDTVWGIARWGPVINGVEEQEAAGGSGQLAVSPNPVKDNVTITTTLPHPNTLTLYDITGRVLLQQSITSSPYHLNTSILSKGVYIVEVKDKEGRSVRGKVVKE